MSDKTYKFLSHYCNGIELNANDTFGWGCSDSVFVSMLDVPMLLEIEAKYGDEGVIAMISKIAKKSPLKALINDKYIAAQMELENYILSDDLDAKDKETWDLWFSEYKKRSQGLK